MEGKYSSAMDAWTPIAKQSAKGFQQGGLSQPFLRADGTEKGTGWLGVQQNQKGQDVTEYSVGVNMGGKEVQIPTVTPNMNQYDIANIKAASEGKGQLSQQVIEKAVEHARMRLVQGLSPYKVSGDYKSK